ncbi:MAG: Holliday junction resolvase RuvX [Hyphomicrobiales bacterium]|nr:Holliday junction resolvase RuvX [Hyphomicrobiales bacterium]
MAASNTVTIEDLANTTRAPQQRLIGLDLGTKTIGVAVSDVELRVATPLTTIRRTKFKADAAELLRIAENEKAFAIVIGLPLNMDGSEGPRAQAARAFGRNLSPLLDVPVVYWDERLSTVAAERAMIEADLSRKKRAERIDAAAAAIILEGALGRLANIGSAAAP